MRPIIAFSAILIFTACNSTKENQPSGADGWLKGGTHEKFETVANQLRGFDMAMVETGYRYQELYWAGKDENWEYANYQLEKIRLAIKNGLERRPKRAASAAPFLENSLSEMQQAVDKKDTTPFFKSYLALTANCNACHAKEKVPFFSVQVPTDRQSPIRK